MRAARTPRAGAGSECRTLRGVGEDLHAERGHARQPDALGAKRERASGKPLSSIYSGTPKKASAMRWLFGDWNESKLEGGVRANRVRPNARDEAELAVLVIDDGRETHMGCKPMPR